MVVVLIAFVEYLFAAFILTSISHMATKHKQVWIFFATGLYLFATHFIVFSYIYKVQGFTPEGVMLIISATSLLVGSIILYKNEDLWRHEHDMGDFVYYKKKKPDG